MNENIRSTGPLGAAYPNYWGGDCFGGPPNHVRGMKEGDSPSLLYLVPNGLSDPAQPSWGSWGGRFAATDIPAHYEDAADMLEGEKSIKATVYRWRSAFQNDFVARLGWTVNNWDKCNHHPVVKLAGSDRISVRSGERVTLDASASEDPDGDSLSFYWQCYKEAGDCKAKVAIGNRASAVCHFTAPEVTQTCQLHIVLSVTDDGSPELTSYARIVVTVQP